MKGRCGRIRAYIVKEATEIVGTLLGGALPKTKGAKKDADTREPGQRRSTWEAPPK